MFGWGKSRGEAMPGDGEIGPGGKGEARSEELDLSYSVV